MSGDPAATIQNMESQLDMIADMMRQTATEEQKGLVQDLIRECQENRKQMEALAFEVVEQDEGGDTFQRITHELDRLERMQERYTNWASAPPGSAPPVSPVSAVPTPSSTSALPPANTSHAFGSAGGDSAVFPSSPGPSFAAGASSGEGAAPHLSSGNLSSSGRSKRDKKGKKDKKRDAAANQSMDGFSSGVGDAWGGAAANPGDGASGFDAGWPAGGDSAGVSGGFGDTAAGSGGFGDSGGGWPSSTADAGGHTGGWGDPPITHGTSGGGDGWGDGWGAAGASAASPAPAAPTSTTSHAPPSSSPPLQNPFDSFREPAPSASTRSVGPPASSHSYAPSHGPCATLHIRRPFSEIQDNVRGFEEQFIRAAALAAGVHPDRIKVRSVRAGN